MSMSHESKGLCIMAATLAAIFALCGGGMLVDCPGVGRSNERTQNNTSNRDAGDREVKNILIALILATVGCATLMDKAQKELDRFDAEAQLEKYIERVIGGTSPKPDKTGDEIDLAKVAWYGPDIRNWPVTSDLPQGAYVSGSNLHFPHSKAGQWKVNGDNLEANPWVIVKHGGEWRATTFEWLRKGQTSKPWAKVRFDHIKNSAFAGYQLSKGEEFYVIVAGLSRGADRGTAERTKAVKVVWK